LEIVAEGRRQVLRQPLRQDKGHRGLWRAFMQAITTTGVPPIPYDQILGVARATLAAREALRTRRLTAI